MAFQIFYQTYNYNRVLFKYQSEDEQRLVNNNCLLDFGT